jgi:threonyl-tRNA synthetase
VEFKEEHLKDLSKYMQKIVKENQPFQRIETDYKQAKEIIKMMGEDFKIELLDEFKEQGETVFSFYINTIPHAAAERLLKDCKTDYVKKYTKLTEYLKKLKIEDGFVTFIDMCE